MLQPLQRTKAKHYEAVKALNIASSNYRYAVEDVRDLKRTVADCNRAIDRLLRAANPRTVWTGATMHTLIN
jgi:hypothetical protein